MTNNNKEKILSLLAQAHIADSCFEKKYGFKVNVGEVTEENLEEKNKEYQEQFQSQLEEKLKEDQSLAFFYDLLFNAPSIPVLN